MTSENISCGERDGSRIGRVCLSTAHSQAMPASAFTPTIENAFVRVADVNVVPAEPRRWQIITAGGRAPTNSPPHMPRSMLPSRPTIAPSLTVTWAGIITRTGAAFRCADFMAGRLPVIIGELKLRNAKRGGAGYGNPVSNARLGDDDRGVSGLRFDLLTQLPNVNAEVLRVLGMRGSPDGSEDLLVGHDLAGMTGKE